MGGQERRAAVQVDDPALEFVGAAGPVEAVEQQAGRGPGQVARRRAGEQVDQHRLGLVELVAVEQGAGLAKAAGVVGGRRLGRRGAEREHGERGGEQGGAHAPVTTAALPGFVRVRTARSGTRRRGSLVHRSRPKMLDLFVRRAVRWLLRPACPQGATTLAVDGEPVTAPEVGRRRLLLAATVVAGVALLAVGVHAVTGNAAPGPSSPAQPRLDVRLAADLPVVDLGWIRIRDHFMVTVGPGAGRGAGLGDLLVLADATFAPRAAFPQHRHAGVEIVSLVLDGTLTHHGAEERVELPAGAAQVMLTGAGIVHAEANDSDRPVRMLQLWFVSPEPGRSPGYQLFAPTEPAELTALPFAELRRDVQIRRATLAAGATATWSVGPRRAAYVLCVGGSLALDDVHLDDGDGAALTAGRFTATAGPGGPARLVVIELAAPN